MRLFLSSENLGRFPDRFTDLAGSNKKLAYIGNAKDYIDNTARKAKVAEHKAQFESIGFTFTEFDLRDYFEQPPRTEILDGYGSVWCSGGNTFLLRAALKQSGFDDIIVTKVRNNEVMYGGSSAGAIVAGPTLKGVEYGDDPLAVKATYGMRNIWEGLGLVDFVIIPHWESEWFGEQAKQMAGALNQENIKKLTDGQVLIVSGNNMEFLK